MREKLKRALGVLECVWWAIVHMEEAATEGERMKRLCPDCRRERPARGWMGPG